MLEEGMTVAEPTRGAGGGWVCETTQDGCRSPAEPGSSQRDQRPTTETSSSAIHHCAGRPGRDGRSSSGWRMPRAARASMAARAVGPDTPRRSATIGAVTTRCAGRGRGAGGRRRRSGLRRAGSPSAGEAPRPGRRPRPPLRRTADCVGDPSDPAGDVALTPTGQARQVAPDVVGDHHAHRRRYGDPGPPGQRPADEHTSQPAVAVSVGVDRLELGMDYRGEGDGVELARVGEPHEVLHQSADVFGRAAERMPPPGGWRRRPSSAPAGSGRRARRAGPRGS